MANNIILPGTGAPVESLDTTGAGGAQRQFISLRSNTQGDNADVIGPTNDVAPTTDTAAASLNARLQRLAQLLSGAATLTSLTAAVSATASGPNLAIAAVSGKRIRVLAMVASTNGAVNVNLQSHTTTTNATGILYTAGAGDGAVLPYNPAGWLTTTISEALDVNLSSAVTVGLTIVYVTL